MVLEIVEIAIKEGKEAEFEEAISATKAHFQNAPGCKRIQLYRVIEMPRSYRLFIEWEHIDYHMKDFRNSPEFADWRAKVGPFFEGTPNMMHGELIVTS